ncbi:hypothetical protein G6F61_015170 [Rhizopus arrhizus]|nr:hypothetical protein G6F61_015170 [Rhizopus arrhizus]
MRAFWLCKRNLPPAACRRMPCSSTARPLPPSPLVKSTTPCATQMARFAPAAQFTSGATWHKVVPATVKALCGVYWPMPLGALTWMCGCV